MRDEYDSAWHKGNEAYLKDKVKNKNPYDKADPNHSAWEDGWEQRKKLELRFKQDGGAPFKGYSNCEHKKRFCFNNIKEFVFREFVFLICGCILVYNSSNYDFVSSFRQFLFSSGIITIIGGTIWNFRDTFNL
jgi:ribosome modulation factor